MTADPESRVRAAVAELADALVALAAAPTRADADTERLYGINEACQALGGIGRSLIYTELRSGRLRALHVGRRVLIPASAIRDYIAMPAQPTEKGRARRDSARPMPGGRNAAVLSTT